MIYWNSSSTVQTLKKILDQDNIILASGDTVLGLWGRVTQQVFENMNKIKERSDRPYLIIIGSLEKLSLFTEQPISEQLQNLIETCWPGPVTLIFKAKADLPAWAKSSDGTIAIRIPDHEGLLKLLKEYDALFSTSANIHTKPIPESVASVDRAILDQVKAVCIEEGQFVYPQIPSTILNVSKGTIEIIREGVIHKEMLQDLIG